MSSRAGHATTCFTRSTPPASGGVGGEACVECHRRRLQVKGVAILTITWNCRLIVGVLGRRALQQPPRDVDSMHVKRHPCFENRVQCVANRLLQARMPGDICQKRWGGAAMDRSMEMKIFPCVRLVDIAPPERHTEDTLGTLFGGIDARAFPFVAGRHADKLGEDCFGQLLVEEWWRLGSKWPGAGESVLRSGTRKSRQERR